MSDYPNPNLHRSDGISARGILITLGVVGLVFVVLAAVGTGGGGSGTAVVPEGGTATEPAAVTPAPAVTE